MEQEYLKDQPRSATSVVEQRADFVRKTDMGVS
jgi:hypothetical protein